MKVKRFTMLINGQRMTAEKSFLVVNPATEEIIAEVPEVDAPCVEQALTAAKDAFQTWSRLPLSQRQPIILKYADLLEQNRDAIIGLLIAETGKPIGYDTIRQFCDPDRQFDEKPGYYGTREGTYEDTGEYHDSLEAIGFLKEAAELIWNKRRTHWQVDFEWSLGSSCGKRGTLIEVDAAPVRAKART